MRRRTLLAAVAGIGTMSGCALSTPTADGMDTEFTVCGPSSSQSCDTVGIDTTLADSGEHATTDTGEAAGVDRQDGEIQIIGRTYGIGDPTCRETELTDVSVSAETLQVTVSNREDPPLVGSCAETRGENYYRLRVSAVDDPVSSVTVRHETDGEVVFEATLSV